MIKNVPHKKVLSDLKAEIEDLRTLSQETHVRIRHLGELYEELNADDNSTDAGEDEDEILEENRKYHGLNSNDQQMNFETLSLKACNNN